MNLIYPLVVAIALAVVFFLQIKSLKAKNQQLTTELGRERRTRQRNAWRVAHESGRGKTLDLSMLPCGLSFQIKHVFCADCAELVYLVIECLGHDTWKNPRILKVDRDSLFWTPAGTNNAGLRRYLFLLHRFDVVEARLKSETDTDERVLIVTKGSIPDDGVSSRVTGQRPGGANHTKGVIVTALAA